jgi:peptidoglycan hydrolase FlgJ
MDIQKSSFSPLGTLAASQQVNQALSQAEVSKNSFASILQGTQAVSDKSSDTRTKTPTDADTIDLNPAATSEFALSAEEHAAHDAKLKQAFSDFVGQTFFTELIKSYRSTQTTNPYFHGGQAEKIFQGQLDQVLSESLAERSADKIADPMFDQFQRSRKPTT